LLKEPNTKRDYLLGGAVGIGMLLFFFDAPATTALAPNPALGNLLAAITGFTWALTITGLRNLGKKPGTNNLSVVATGNLTAFALAAPFALPIESIVASEIAALGYLGVFQIGLAYVCLTRGVRHVPAFETSALILLEPAMNPVWTFLLHGETPGPLSLCAGALIIGATLAHTWASKNG
jgi:drug/metabolite transporter (DMT)-like permease